MDPAAETGERQRQKRFNDIIMPEVDVMYRVAMSITRNHADAEDLVQDSLLRAYRGLDNFDGRYPRAWLLTILRNAQINRVRRRRPELLRDPDASMERFADVADGGRTAEEVVVDQGFDHRVETAFNELPDKFRSVVTLVDVQGRSYAEAAQALDVPVGTIMSRLHRARRRIREQLRAEGFDPTFAEEVEP